MRVQEYVVKRTGESSPICEMNNRQAFRPMPLWPSRQSVGYCRRLGSFPDGRVVCEYDCDPRFLSPIAFTMPGGLVRERLEINPIRVAVRA
jgi:hypothetical protein